MTSASRRGPSPSAADQRRLNLRVKRGFSHPEPKQWKPEDEVTLQHEVVLAQRILNNPLRADVMNAVDLDDNAKLFPSHIEDVCSGTAESDDLATRLWKETLATPAREVQLAECLRPTHQVKQYSFDESATAMAPDGEQRCADRARRSQSLLDNHRQYQRGLAISTCPQCRPHGGNLGSRARDPGRLNVCGSPSTRLPDVYGAGSEDACATRYGDANSVNAEASQSGRDEAGHAIEDPTWSCLEDPRPAHTDRR